MYKVDSGIDGLFEMLSSFTCLENKQLLVISIHRESVLTNIFLKSENRWGILGDQSISTRQAVFSILVPRTNSSTLKPIIRVFSLFEIYTEIFQYTTDTLRMMSGSNILRSCQNHIFVIKIDCAYPLWFLELSLTKVTFLRCLLDGLVRMHQINKLLLPMFHLLQTRPTPQPCSLPPSACKVRRSDLLHLSYWFSVEFE